MSGRSTIKFNSNALQDSQASFDHWDKAREQSKIRWHFSKMEGYISDEFRSIEFAD